MVVGGLNRVVFSTREMIPTTEHIFRGWNWQGSNSPFLQCGGPQLCWLIYNPHESIDTSAMNARVHLPEASFSNELRLGFHQWRYPNSWMVYGGKSENRIERGTAMTMEDLWQTSPREFSSVTAQAKSGADGHRRLFGVDQGPPWRMMARYGK